MTTCLILIEIDWRHLLTTDPSARHQLEASERVICQQQSLFAGQYTFKEIN